MTRFPILASGLLMTLTLSVRSQTFADAERMQQYSGFYTFYYQEETGKLFLAIDRLEEDFLYIRSLGTGVGHNDLGLDRGQIRKQSIVRFRYAGDRILLVQPNLDYRAVSENPDEVKAVKQAFATSVLHGFKILDRDEGTFLVDLTPVLFSDETGVVRQLATLGEGSYEPDPRRSAVELSRTRAFPDNVELNSWLTLSGKPEGRLVGRVTPDPSHITFQQRLSFVRLPDDDYRPREFHPGSGCIPVTYRDYAAPVGEPMDKKYIIRHRLEKQHPDRPLSPPVEPIVYYLDPGTPEPVRSALLEGAGWWEEAFREIGFSGAFRVEILPDDADPLDVRYNVIQWVHRSTRGWSYGNSVVDPRTGEIIKGHVSLGSLRIRQDYLIARALTAAPHAGETGSPDPMLELALARIRQLSAHEIGHTLGFTHNFAASTNDRASVMDYPHPMIRVNNGMIDLDDAYAEGIGEWDKVTVAYAYGVFQGDEPEALRGILREASGKGFRFISDTDARARGGAHPYAHLWDNGESALEELQNVLEVRSLAMEQFSRENLREGEPVSELADLFVPLYFFHRYQLEAAVKLVSGVEYSYAVKGEAPVPHRPVEAALQREAIESILGTLSPEVLAIPRETLELFPPRAYGYSATRESFEGTTGLTFDYLAPAAGAAHFTLDLLLHPERVNRLVLQKALDPGLPGAGELFTSLIKSAALEMPSEPGMETELRHTVRFIVIDHLIRLATSGETLPQVKALADDHLARLKEALGENERDGVFGAYDRACIRQIEERKVHHLDRLPGIPPGAPIGTTCSSH